WESSWRPQAQQSWLDERRQRNDWRQVRVIDGSQLVDWLNEYPAVELWLAHRMGLVPDGSIETCAERWELARSFGAPPNLLPELFLANRDEARRGLDSIHGAPPGGVPDPTHKSLFSATTHQVEEALKRAGYAAERARILAVRSAGNLTSLIRCLQNLSTTPAWAESGPAADLAVAVLLGE